MMTFQTSARPAPGLPTGLTLSIPIGESASFGGRGAANSLFAAVPSIGERISPAKLIEMLEGLLTSDLDAAARLHLLHAWKAPLLAACEHTDADLGEETGERSGSVFEGRLYRFGDPVRPVRPAWIMAGGSRRRCPAVRVCWTLERGFSRLGLVPARGFRPHDRLGARVGDPRARRQGSPVSDLNRVGSDGRRVGRGRSRPRTSHTALGAAEVLAPARRGSNGYPQLGADSV